MHVSILPKRIDQLSVLISNVEAYYSEIDLDESSQSESIQSAITSDNRISKVVRPKKYNRIRKILLKSFQIDILPLDHILPFLIVNQLSLSLLDEDHETSMDHTLWDIAKKQHKVLGGLESTKSQIQILQAIPWEYQLKQLIDVSKNVTNYRQFVLKIYDAYNKEDIRNLYVMTQESLGKYKNLLLKERNISMVNNIFSQKDQSSFNAIGAAHLGGYNGMLRLIKNRGFELKRVE